MRALLAIVILAALGWSGWWYLQASTRERALEDWLADRRSDGWVAETGELRVTGFPNRVDTIVTDLELADPEAGWSWKADGLEIRSLSYKPNHIIAALPGEQTFSTPLETLHAESANLRGSVIFEPTPRLGLERTTFEIGDLRITSDSGWTAGIGKAILAVRQAAEAERPFSYDLAFEGERIALPREILGAMRAEGVLPAEVGHLSLDTTLAFDKAWDRPAIEGEEPVIEDVRIRKLSLAWGKLTLAGRGRLGVDDRGYADGKIDLEARNWEKMVELAVSAGMLDASIGDALRGGLGLLSHFSGSDGALKVPLSFSDGMTRLGPIVLGPAPVLANRR